MKTIAKNTILTPISVVETKIDQNIKVLKEFVEHNWSQLNVGAERGMEYETAVIRQPQIIGYRTVEFHWTSNPASFIKIYVNGSDVKTDWDLGACLTAIEKLRDYAENPRNASKYDLSYDRIVAG
jgi:hypothetical protein